MPDQRHGLNLSNLIRNPQFAIGIITVAYLVLGFLLVTDYSQSWDEKTRYQYGQESLSAYVGNKIDLDDEKGAFFSMVGVLGAQVFKRIVPGWITFDGWHFVTYLSFVMGVYFFYRLCHRLTNHPAPALAATLLFSTQPVIWGHAFINPKDTPFMAFFIASVSLGLDMADRCRAGLRAEEKETPAENRSIRDRLARLPRSAAVYWKSAPRWAAWTLPVLLIGLVCLMVVYLQYRAAVTPWALSVYQAITHRTVDLSSAKAQVAVSWMVLAAAGALLLGTLISLRVVFPPVIDGTVVAGVVLGLCSDIRTLGPAAGLLVVVYFLLRSDAKALPTLLKYLTAAAVTTYLFWPYLWSSPVTNYLSSIQQAQSFPWDGIILFQGIEYTKDTLPAGYLPTTMVIQLTEPALLLIAVGFILACLALVRKPTLRVDVLLLGAWFAAPIAAAIYGHSTIYNNFRQFLFAVPPLFILAALALQTTWDLLKRRSVWFIPLAILALLPGLYWDVALHPYEYIYYNSLVGGVQGAFRQYETDYWCTSYKEAVEYVNRVAPEGATVAVTTPRGIAVTYIRSDIDLELLSPDFTETPDYAILTSRWDHDLTNYPDAPVIYQVSRAGAVLAVVKDTRQSVSP